MDRIQFLISAETRGTDSLRTVEPVVNGDAAIRWSGFRNGHRDWDLSDLGPFTFDRAQYEAALGKPVDPSATAR